MQRCLIFAASLLLAFAAISSASMAQPADWKHTAASPAEARGSGGVPSWATMPSPRLFAFMTIRL